MTYGLVPSGFNIKTATNILNSLKNAVWAKLGADFNLDPDEPFGQILGVQSIQMYDVWSLGLTLYNALDPDVAEGTLLDNLCSLVGITRLDATYATGTVTCSGVAGTSIPTGSIVRVLNGERFTTDETVVIPGGGSIDVGVTAENTGPIVVGATNLNQIVTAITGWNTVSNALEIDSGTNIETDAELRIRRRLSLQAGGAGTEGAIRSAVLTLADVDACVVISNRDDVIVDGREPHSFETIVWPNTLSATVKEELAEKIFRVMPAGIYSEGSLQYTITDSRGYSQVVRFSYATQVTIDVVITYSKNSLFPDNGETLMKTAVENIFSNMSIGDDVNHSQIHSALFNACAGITDIDVTIDDGVTGPIEDPITIDADEIAIQSAWGGGSSITLV